MPPFTLAAPLLRRAAQLPLQAAVTRTMRGRPARRLLGRLLRLCSSNERILQL